MEDQSTKIRIVVDGMHCAGCTNAVEKAIGRVPVVTGVSVQLTTETAEIHYSGSDAPIDEIRKAIEDAGYKVSEKKKITS